MNTLMITACAFLIFAMSIAMLLLAVWIFLDISETLATRRGGKERR